MKFCPECGKEWNGSKFCAECGKDLRSYINGGSEQEQAPVVKEEMAFSADFDFLGQLDNLAEKAESERKRMEAEAKVTEEKRLQEEAEKKAEAERMRKEAEARAAEEKRRKEEFERQEAVRQAELKKRREALFSQRFQRNGNIIIFGRYPQSHAGDSITSKGADGYCTIGGKEYFRVNSTYEEHKTFRTITIPVVTHYIVEPIRWEIIQETDESVLVVAEKVLSQRAFREDKYANCANDYINSDIRKWLNGEFLNSSFSKEEQSFIMSTDIDYNLDRIFLLSREESKLTKIDRDKLFHYTSFAGDAVYSSWWLRDHPSYRNDEANVVSPYGYPSSECAYYRCGVVPALRIDKTKLC